MVLMAMTIYWFRRYTYTHTFILNTYTNRVYIFGINYTVIDSSNSFLTRHVTQKAL